MKRKSEEKKRADLLLVDRGLVTSREMAQRMILANKAFADEEPIKKPGMLVSVEAKLRIKENEKYVSRGGLKLEAALKAFGVLVSNQVALDVGASTGGFTDVLLQQGIKRVYAIDVGTNQLAWKIRKDPRVICFEKTNAKNLTPKLIPDLIDLIVMDVSFISITKILPVLIPFAKPKTDWVILIKPQFEAGKEKVGKGGIVRSAAVREEILKSMMHFADTLGLKQQGLIESPITGTDGNHEYFIHWRMT